MNVDDGHFERTGRGSRPESDELTGQACAVRSRLRSAFQRVGANEALTERIHRQLAAASTRDRPQPHRTRRIVWRLMPLAAAAVVVIVATAFLANLGQPRSAQAELASIHETNVRAEASDALHHKDDPVKLAAFLEDKLGTPAALPKGDDVDFCGCCTVSFRGESVASYMLSVDGEQVSIVIAGVDPDKLSFGRKFSRYGRTFWACRSGPCDMVGTILGDYTYFAVGNVGHEKLTNILTRLVRGGRKY